MFRFGPRLKLLVRALHALTLLGLLLGGFAPHAEPGYAQPAGPQPQGGRYTAYLPILARPGAAPSSDALIDAAQERGEIDAETYNISYLPPFVPGSRKYYALSVKSRSTPYDTVTYVCPNQTYEEPANVEIWLQTDLDGTMMQHSIGADGKTLEGTATWTHTSDTDTNTYISKWKMTPLPPE
jgi:hypothetical protein